MARPDILRGTYVNMLLGNEDGPPETFDPICGINTRSFTDQVNTNDVFNRDCADPEDIPFRELIATGEQWDMSGSGLLNRAQLAALQAVKGLIKNWRYELGEPTGDEVYGGYYGGAAMLTRIAVIGADGDFVQIELTVASNGAWTFTEVP